MREIPRHRPDAAGGRRAPVARRLSGDGAGRGRGRARPSGGGASSARSLRLKALLEREGTNHGQWLDVSGQECIAFALEDAIPEWYLSHNIRRRTGDQAREAGTGVYPCRDGYISMVAGRLGTAKAFKTLVQWIAESGTPGGAGAAGRALAGLQVPPEPARHRPLRRDLRPPSAPTRSKQELYREGQARQIAIAPVNAVADIVADPQLRCQRLLPLPA